MNAVKKLWTRPEPYGLILRLLLMPIGACWDLFGHYWVSHQWVYHGGIPPGQYGGIFPYLPFLHVHAGWLWLIKPLIGLGDPWGEGLVPSASMNPFWITPEALYAFYLQPRIHTTLFLLKLPYALLELSLIWILLRYAVRAQALKRKMAWFLWLNPVSLYVIYLYGSWDILPVALTMISMLLVSRRPVLAGLCFALAVPMKFFMLALFPFFLLFGTRTRQGRFRFCAAILLPLLLWLAIAEWSGVHLFMGLLTFPHYEMVTSLRIPLLYHDSLYPLFLGYVLLIFHGASFGDVSFGSLISYCTAALLLFYSFAFFHVHHFIWVVPLLALLIASKAQLFWPFVVQVMCLAIYTLQWERVLTTYMIAPLNVEFFFNQRSPYEWIGQFIDPEKVIGLAHSGFAAASLWMIYLVLRGRNSRKVVL